MPKIKNLCPLCKIVKKFSAFYRRNNGQNRSAYCKDCAKEYAKKQYKKGRKA
jgi:superfamily II helicase